MRTVTLQATAKHPTREEGEQYEVLGGQALVDLAMRRAVAYRAPKETLHLPENNKYQTRNEVAEPTATEEPKPKKSKRKYKRRDLNAE